MIDQEPETCELWTDHLPAINVFMRLRTQWQVGMSGPVGLRYETLGFILELEGIPREDWPLLVTEVQIMERITLQKMSG